MLKYIARKRTSLEKKEWEHVREIMPRKQATRGIQYEALEFLFEHLYEKVLEEELRDHLVKVKGRLQQKGDPVKSAINLAIKELQRLHNPTFEIIKIQEASLVGKTKRYVQLNFTGFNAVVNYEQYKAYLQDILSDEEALILRSVANLPSNINPIVFPGLKEEYLERIRSYSLINFFPETSNDSLTQYYYIPENYANLNLLLLYETEKSSRPFLAFLSNCSTVSALEESEYIMLRGEEKSAKLTFLHKMWEEQKSMALDIKEARSLWEKSGLLFKRVKEADIPDIGDAITREILFNSLLNSKVQKRAEPSDKEKNGR